MLLPHQARGHIGNCAVVIVDELIESIALVAAHKPKIHLVGTTGPRVVFGISLDSAVNEINAEYGFICQDFYSKP